MRGEELVPGFGTLGELASWVTRTGRVDRSACAELRAGQVVVERGMMKRVWCGGGWALRGEAEVTGEYLQALLDAAPVRRLVGDYRGGRANAMRYVGGDVPEDRHFLHPCERRLLPNPNRGASRVKVLGLPGVDGEGGGEGGREGRKEGRWVQRVGVVHRSYKGFGGFRRFVVCPKCGGEVTCLLMPLCTRAEYVEAQSALCWVRAQWAVRPNGPGTAGVARLQDRYGLLWPVRRLLCIKCLGVKYNSLKRFSQTNAAKAERARVRGVRAEQGLGRRGRGKAGPRL